MAPGKGADMPARVCVRQAEDGDIGAMAQRVDARHLTLTHVASSLGALMHGHYAIPEGAFDRDRLSARVESSGSKGNIIVGTGRVTLRVPLK